MENRILASDGGELPLIRRIVVAPAGLNLRAGPSTLTAIVASLPMGTAVEVLEDGEWARVRAGEQTGFVKSEFLGEMGAGAGKERAVTEMMRPAGEGSRKRVVTAPAGLNVRVGPSTDTAIVARLSVGTAVQVLEDGEWARVLVNGETGFVKSEFLGESDQRRNAAGQAEAETGEFRFVAWPTVEKRITQGFGENPELYKKFKLPGHEGIDLRSPIGTPYFCVAPGVVIWVSDRRRDGEPSAYGWHVIIDHGNGYSTLYAHARPEVPVKSGDRLEAGDIVAFSGNTGNSSGPHLHLTLKKKGTSLPGWPPDYMDPLPFLSGLMD